MVLKYLLFDKNGIALKMAAGLEVITRNDMKCNHTHRFKIASFKVLKQN